jgi:hypothetical protein
MRKANRALHEFTPHDARLKVIDFILPCLTEHSRLKCCRQNAGSERRRRRQLFFPKIPRSRILPCRYAVIIAPKVASIQNQYRTASNCNSQHMLQTLSLPSELRCKSRIPQCPLFSPFRLLWRALTPWLRSCSSRLPLLR